MCSRRRDGHLKYPGPDVDVRENIIKYNDDGEGEEDMTASTKLQRCTKQLTDASEMIQCNLILFYNLFYNFYNFFFMLKCFL